VIKGYTNIIELNYCYTFLPALLIPTIRPLLFVGPTGTGKSVYVKEKLMNHLDKERFLPFFINFSARTSANQTQVSSTHTEYNRIWLNLTLRSTDFRRAGTPLNVRNVTD